MDELLQLEKELSFHSFNHLDAYHVCQMIIEEVEKKRLKPVRIRAVLHDDIVFQYLMDGKTGVKWLEYKQNTLEKYQHSTYYIYLLHQDDDFQKQELLEKRAICGGGFPIIVQGKIIGGLYVSGLRHDEDHQLIVDVLKKYKNR